MSVITKSILSNGSQLTVGELSNLSSPRAIVYSRLKCIREIFVNRIKKALSERSSKEQ